jgi:hypothetical protein
MPGINSLFDFFKINVLAHIGRSGGLFVGVFRLLKALLLLLHPVLKFPNLAAHFNSKLNDRDD